MWLEDEGLRMSADSESGNGGSKADEPTDETLESIQERRESEVIHMLAQKPRHVDIMQVLVDAGGQELDASTICEHAGISRQTFYNTRDLLLDVGLMEQPREVNGSPVYRANMESPQVGAWKAFRTTLRDAYHD